MQKDCNAAALSWLSQSKDDNDDEEFGHHHHHHGSCSVVTLLEGKKKRPGRSHSHLHPQCSLPPTCLATYFLSFQNWDSYPYLNFTTILIIKAQLQTHSHLHPECSLLPTSTCLALPPISSQNSLSLPTPRNALSVRPLVRWSVTFFTPSNAHDISATKRATGDPLVSKRPDFRGRFGFSKKYEI